MTEIVRVTTGKVIPAQIYARDLERAREVEDAQNEALRIRAEAEAEAKRIITAAQEKSAQMEARLRSIADEQLAQFMDVRAVDEVATAVQTALETAAELRSDFDQFTPWMRDFVAVAVERITGTLPPETLWSGLIRQSLLDIRDRWNLIIRCHPSRVALLSEVVAKDPILTKAVKGVQPNRALSEDDCLIQSATGVTDISLSTQIVTLMLALDKLSSDAKKADVS